MKAKYNNSDAENKQVKLKYRLKLYLSIGQSSSEKNFYRPDVFHS
jgi:hypothetical protein